jgi:N-acyl-D-amino-acid deacylase
MNTSRPPSLLLAAAVAVALTACSTPTAPLDVDLLIRGGTIYDGEHAQAQVGDIGIRGERIAFVGNAPAGGVNARRTIEARGLVVAPGFIDVHTHADADLLSPDAQKRLNLGFLTQGVTTVVIGNDGFGTFDIAGQVGKLRERGIGTNVALYVGFGPVRQNQLGDANRAPDAAQLEAMKQLVSRALCQGALGLSTGLFYPPQNFSKTEEVIELAKVAARHGGLYDSHVRDESSYNIGLKASIEEVIRVGREAELPVNVAHIKALGVDVHGHSADIIRRIEAEQARGLRITADQYPWVASSTRFSAALIPPWAVAGGREAMLKRFDDPAVQQRLRDDIRESLRLRGGAAAILFSAGNPKLVGSTLEQVAAATQRDAVETTIAVLREGDMAIVSFNQSEDDIRAFMKRPWVMTSSDSVVGHPRAVASFSHKYAQYVVKEKVIDLAQFVRSSSALSADTLGLKERGHLRAGHYADVVVFDPARYRARASYTAPGLLSEGVVTVLVNGRVAIDDGKPTGTAAGQPLLRAPKAGSCPAG